MSEKIVRITDSSTLKEDWKIEEMTIDSSKVIKITEIVNDELGKYKYLTLVGIDDNKANKIKEEFEKMPYIGVGVHNGSSMRNGRYIHICNFQELVENINKYPNLYNYIVNELLQSKKSFRNPKFLLYYPRFVLMRKEIEDSGWKEKCQRLINVGINENIAELLIKSPVYTSTGSAFYDGPDYLGYVWVPYEHPITKERIYIGIKVEMDPELYVPYISVSSMTEEEYKMYEEACELFRKISEEIDLEIDLRQLNIADSLRQAYRKAEEIYIKQNAELGKTVKPIKKVVLIDDITNKKYKFNIEEFIQVLDNVAIELIKAFPNKRIDFCNYIQPIRSLAGNKFTLYRYDGKIAEKVFETVREYHQLKLRRTRGRRIAMRLLILTILAILLTLYLYPTPLVQKFLSAIKPLKTIIITLTPKAWQFP